MKAKRRHELRENVLAIEIGKVADFLRAHGSWLATGVLVIAVAVLAVVVIRGRMRAKEAAVQTRWDRALAARGSSEFDRNQLVKDLTGLTEQTDNKRIAALAAVELGDEYARRLLSAGEQSERKALLKDAEHWYRWAIATFGGQADAVGKARVGLAALYETTGQFAQAAEQYKAVVEATALDGYGVVELARLEMQRMAEMRQPVWMAAVWPMSQPTTQSATQPTSAAASRPAPASAPASAPAGGGA